MPPLAEHHQCEPYEWQCANKRCIPESWQCDMQDDCDDNSDEDSSHCASRTCRPGYFKCANGHCIPQIWKCDVDNDCGDYSDEPLQECCEFRVPVRPESSSVWLERQCIGPAAALSHAPSSLSPRMQRRAACSACSLNHMPGSQMEDSWSLPTGCLTTEYDKRTYIFILHLLFWASEKAGERQRRWMRDLNLMWFFLTSNPVKKCTRVHFPPSHPLPPSTVWPQHKWVVMMCWENLRSLSFYSEWTNHTLRRHRLPRWLSAEESICQCKRCGFDPWVGKIPWSRNWQPTPVFLPGKFHGQRSLVGYSPWGCGESVTRLND